MLKKLRFVLIIATFLTSGGVFAQGVTTSSMGGFVVDESGEGLPGANIKVVHVPSGTTYGASTGLDGVFVIPNMRVGGPYEITISYVGFADHEEKDIYLQLGAKYTFMSVMREESQTLDGIEVVGFREGETDKTGTSTSISEEKLKQLPTIKRSAQDYTRLTPQADGNSFGGRNNLYNNFSLDGSIFNNSFGLDYATPGGQTDAQPVSLDAIEQIQVSVAPFDVRQGGFTGAGINAITRSGTNDFSGSVYSFYRNQSLAGEKVKDTKAPNTDFWAFQGGFRLGGPIVKNKLFFFVNYEADRRNELAHGFVANDGVREGENVTSVSKTDLEAIRTHMRERWNYETGAYEGYFHETYSDKILAKIDWNINKNNSLSVRYNYLDSWKDQLPHPEAIGGRGPTSFRLPFENSSYRIFNKINSIVAELNSTISDKSFNSLLVSYSAFRDHREPFSAPFPTVDIWDNFSGVTNITAGSEMFSTGNLLNQDILQIKDDFTFFKGKHTWTIGVNFEYFKFKNSFNLFYYPWVVYPTVNDFLNDSPLFAVGTGPSEDISDLNALVAAREGNPFTDVNVEVAQFSLYGQDEWQFNQNLNLTFGLRIDMPLYFSEVAPDANIQEFNELGGWKDENDQPSNFDPSTWPNTQVLWSPRFGFNWNAKGDRSQILRGGTGVFTGRIPFVWLGNQATNSVLPDGFGTFQINDTKENFKFPQTWKTNIAYDHIIKSGWKFTIEAMYSKDINAVIHRNYNMLKPSGNANGADNRSIFNGLNETNIYTDYRQSLGDSATALDAGAIMLDNTPKGYQTTVTVGAGKTWRNGFFLNASYTYLTSKDLTSIPAEIAADAFQRNPTTGDPNQSNFANSRYGLQHRVLTSFGWTKRYNNMASTFGIYWEAAKGGRYSYTYAGDMNRDGVGFNDLIYVPADQSEINFGSLDTNNGVIVPASDAESASQWEALNAFIEQDPYLKENRGGYAERHGPMTPWFAQMDLRFLQDFFINVKQKQHSLQLSVDILNFGNLISSSWGVIQLPNNVQPIRFEGYDNSNTPYFSFDPNLKRSFIDDVSLASKWQMQIGLRYSF